MRALQFKRLLETVDKLTGKQLQELAKAVASATTERTSLTVIEAALPVSCRHCGSTRRGSQRHAQQAAALPLQKTARSLATLPPAHPCLWLRVPRNCSRPMPAACARGKTVRFGRGRGNGVLHRHSPSLEAAAPTQRRGPPAQGGGRDAGSGRDQPSGESRKGQPQDDEAVPQEGWPRHRRGPQGRGLGASLGGARARSEVHRRQSPDPGDRCLSRRQRSRTPSSLARPCFAPMGTLAYFAPAAHARQCLPRASWRATTPPVMD